jgi:hypothetical protein
VGALGVVVLDIGLEHRGEMTLVDDEKPVETLGADRPDESCSVRIGSGRSPRGTEYFDAFSTEDLVEDGTEPLVPIVHQVLDGVDSVFSSFREVAAIWAHQAALAAPSVTPPMRTFPVATSLKNGTWSVFKRTDSTVKRSQAMIEAPGPA